MIAAPYGHHSESSPRRTASIGLADERRDGDARDHRDGRERERPDDAAPVRAQEAEQSDEDFTS